MEIARKRDLKISFDLYYHHITPFSRKFKIIVLSTDR